MEQRKLYFDIEKVEIADDGIDVNDPPQFATCRVFAFCTGVSRHGTTMSLETLQKYGNSIEEKPLIFELDRKLGEQDFGTHHENVTVAAGFCVPGTIEYIQLEDGRYCLSVLCKIWRFYSGKFLSIFTNTNTTQKSVSVEMLVFDSVKTDDYLEEILAFSFSAICVLGEKVLEASPSAHLEMLTFAEQQNNAYQEAYQLEFGNRYIDLDFTIPDKVKVNAQKGLDLHKETGKGANAVSLSVAHHLVKSKQISHDKAKQMAQFFGKRTTVHEFTDKKSSSAIVYALHGGKEGRDFATNLVTEMETRDRRMTSYFSVEDNGKGSAIKVNKSKDAMSNTSWGKVDKTALMHKVLNASNYKSLINDVYLQVESGWEDHPSSSLKYPVMQITGDTAVYNKGALGSALGYAETEGESEVVSKVKGIRKKMGIDEPDKEAMSLMNDPEKEVEQKKEDMTAVSDKQDVPAKEDMAKRDDNQKQENKETPEEENKETPAEQEREKKDGTEKVDMSLDAYLDIAYILEMLKEETIAREEVVDGQDDLADLDFSMCKMAKEELEAKGQYCTSMTAAKGMFALVKKISAKQKAVAEKMCKMEADLKAKDDENKAYMAENEELKKGKMAVEDKMKMDAVETVMAQLMDAGMPKSEMEAVRAEGEKFSFAQFGEWEQSAKAKAFNYALKNTKKNVPNDGITRMATPWYGMTPSVKEEDNSGSVWDRLKKQ